MNIVADNNPQSGRRRRLQQLGVALLAVTVVILIVVLSLPTRQMATPPEQASLRPEAEPAITEAAQQSPRQARYTFDGAPASAQPWQPNDWDIAVHARDAIDHTWRALPPMPADHGADCSGPPATHEIAAYEDTVFLCKDHIMTAINAGGYGVIYLTPNHMLDFSKSEAIISFDVSTLRTSGRDWIDLWITPYEDQLALPLQDWLPDLQGEPRNAVHIRMDGGITETLFRATVVRNFQAHEVKGTWRGYYQDVLQPDAQRRDTFELRISRTHLAFGMPKYNLWWIDSAIEDLGWHTGVVQFGHHTYTPAKSCSDCGPNTWHWDNISLSPARPFTIIRGRQRMIDEESDSIVTFPQTAPLDAHVRFSAFGTNIELSFDQGATWQPAEKQAQEADHQDHAYSYWTAVPAGVTDMRLRGQGILNYGWHAQDFAIWSLHTSSKRP